jgi:hypothetical protein
MSDLGKCDLCDKPARWAVVVSGCSEHKIALKATVDSASTNNASHVIRCKIVGGAWNGKVGTIIGTVPDNGAFRVQIDGDICAAFFGSELQAVA